MSRGVGVTEALRDWLPEWSLQWFELLSLSGDLLVIVPALALVYLLDVRRGLSRGEREGPMCSDRTAFLVAAVFGGLALVVALEAAFGLSRPPAEWHAVEASPYGFPSGHTMAATVFWGALAGWTTIGTRRSRLALASVIVALVGVSRLVLGVHYLVDVIASVAFGVAFLWVIWWIARGRPDRAFAVAVAVALVALAITGGGERAVLAVAGTVGAGVGWWALERPPVRRGLVDVVERVRG